MNAPSTRLASRLNIPRRDFRRLSRTLGLLATLGLALPGLALADAKDGVDDSGTPRPAAETASDLGNYLAGIVASSQRDYGSAADFMNRALGGDPENIELLNDTFMLMAAEGRFDEAVVLAGRLVEVGSENAIARLVLAVDAVGRGDDDGALDALESLPDRGIATLTRPLLEAWVTLNRDGLEAAEAELLPLADQQGFTALYQLHRALLNDVAGQPEGAAEAYDAALGAVSESSLRLTSLAGNFFERQGDIERARALYDDFALRNPDSLMLEQEHARLASGGTAVMIFADYREGMAAALFDFASLLLQERIEEMAMVYSHLALQLDPNLLLARVLVGEMLQEQERHTAAIEAYRQIPTTSPLAFSAQLRMAEELDALEQTDEAISLLRETAEAWPERFEPHYRIGNVLRAQERFSEAAAAYDLAMARLEEPGSRHWTLFYFRGISRERSQDWNRAEEDFLRALELEPEQPYVMNYLAYSWVEQKRNLTEAEQMLKRAVELRPDDGYIVDSLGWVYYRLERYPEAVVELEKAVALRPSDPVINDHLGDAYWRTGRGREAQVQWRRALSLEPEEEDEKKILEKLEGGLKPDPEDI